MSTFICGAPFTLIGLLFPVVYPINLGTRYVRTYFDHILQLPVLSQTSAQCINHVCEKPYEAKP